MQRGLMAMAALVMSGALTIQAQTPHTPQQQPVDPAARPADPQRPGDTTQRAGTATDQVITITGCLKEEKDIPGRRPNLVERAGITEDYILTGVKMAQTSAVSGIGLASMYEIEGIAEGELKKHLGHHVEITGRVAQTTGVTGDDVPDFQATSLKMVSAICPAVK